MARRPADFGRGGRRSGREGGLSSPEISAALADLRSLPKFGAGIGLHRVDWLCRELREESWLAGLDAIRVTGSNGKGSTCAMIAAILGELGIGYGLYTSPHLLAFNERIVVAGKPIADDDLSRSIRWVLARRREYEAAEPGDTVGAFEAFTALALHHFARARPEALVAEAGIGGRYDPVRVVPGRLVGLTALDLEHVEILGGTLELIAYEKADLCPDGGMLVLGEVDREIRRRLAAYCRLRGVRLLDTQESTVLFSAVPGGAGTIADVEIFGERFRELEIALPGRHQVSNAAVAILLVREWLARHRPDLAATEIAAAVRRGLAGTRWPGRLQRVSAPAETPEIFVDVAHTPRAVEALVETARLLFAGRRIVLVTGVSYDKEVEGIVTRLLPLAARVICTRAYHKGAPAATIAAIVHRQRPDLPVETAERIEDALARARALAAEEGRTILVAGGLFLAVEAVQALRGANPRELWFF